MTTDHAEHEAPPHTHTHGDIVCRAWHLTVRTHRGALVPITTTDLDRLRLPTGWVIVR
jgi:hypothetical protein